MKTYCKESRIPCFTFVMTESKKCTAKWKHIDRSIVWKNRYVNDGMYLKSTVIIKSKMEVEEGKAANVKASRFYYRHREEILERRREKRKEDPKYVERQRQREDAREDARKRKEEEAMERARQREVSKEERRMKREEEKAAKREEEKAAKREEKARLVGVV